MQQALAADDPPTATLELRPGTESGWGQCPPLAARGPRAVTTRYRPSATRTTSTDAIGPIPTVGAMGTSGQNPTWSGTDALMFFACQQDHRQRRHRLPRVRNDMQERRLGECAEPALQQREVWRLRDTVVHCAELWDVDCNGRPLNSFFSNNDMPVPSL